MRCVHRHATHPTMPSAAPLTSIIEPGLWLSYVLTDAPLPLQALEETDSPNEVLDAHVKTSDWGFARLPSISSLFTAVENGHESDFTARLLASRTFHSPDCSGAMADILHVSAALEGLQVKGSTFYGSCTTAILQGES